MEVIQLPTGKTTTRIGFGCAHLVGAVPWAASRRLLDRAFACGIRHFDVAPMYGFADAERLLGTFLACHAGQVTVTTKFGIIPQRKRRILRAIRTAARPFVRWRRRAPSNSAVAVATQPSVRPAVCFDVDAARQSIERSLRNLRTDHIDVLLLHEATPDDLRDDRLLRLLEAAVESGKIGAFGTGSSRDAVSGMVRYKPEYCPVVQHRQSLLDAALNTFGSFNIYHGMFSPELRNLIASILRDSILLARWSQELSTDLSLPNSLSRLVAKASMLSHPDALWLIASSVPERIESTCVAADTTSNETARRFDQMIRDGALAQDY